MTDESKTETRNRQKYKTSAEDTQNNAANALNTTAGYYLLYTSWLRIKNYSLVSWATHDHPHIQKFLQNSFI